MELLTICVVLMPSIQWVLPSPINRNASDLKYLNEWRQTRDWNCNTPLVKDHLTLSLYQNKPESNDNERFLLLYGGSLDSSKLSDETWKFSLRSKVWSHLSQQADTERPSGRKFHTMTSLCGTTVLMFGGKGKDGQALNDSWVFESDTETWKRPTIISDFPVPALFRHAALAVHDSYGNCTCKQSVVVLSDQNDMWPTVYQIRCLEDRSVYQWRKIQFQCNTTCGSHFEYATCPEAGRAHLSVSILNESVVIAIAKNGLWKYDVLQENWTFLEDIPNDTAIEKKGANMECAVYMSQLKSYVLFGGKFGNDIISFFLDNKKWERQAALGRNPMASMTAVVNDSVIVAYGGTSATGCHQYLKALHRIESTWVWINIGTAPVQPNLTPQFFLGMYKNKLYVCGKSVRRQQKYFKDWLPEMWTFDTVGTRWFKVGFQPARQVCTSSRGSLMSALLHVDLFVVFGHPHPIKTKAYPWIYSYRISNNTWQTQKTVPAPQFRKFYTMSSFNETTAYLFGGGNGSRRSKCYTALNDLWTLHYKDNILEWILIQDNTKTRNYPVGRMRHAMVIIGPKLYLYGGYDTYRQSLNDFWQYDIIQNSWTTVATDNVGPIALSPYWSIFATTMGNQMILTLGCSDRQFMPPKVTVDHCNGTKPQETWLYNPERKIWSKISSTHDLSDIFEISLGLSTRLMYNQGSLLLANVLNDLDRARIYYMPFTCPEGYYSNNTIVEPCRPCPIGKYSNVERNGCQICPNQLTTVSSGMHSMSQCNKCVESYCAYGKCFVIHSTNASVFPQPKCYCTFGFTGDHCDYPTYYLATLGVIILLTGVILLAASLIISVKRRKVRETELKTRVQELLGVWQIKYEELTLMDLVGVGAFGKVYKSEYRETVVAVKVLNLPEELDTTNEFAREIRFIQTIRHPNVVMFIGAGKTNDNCPFLVTEFVSRGSLRNVLDNESVSLPWSRKLHFAIGAARGLNFLHTLTPPRIHRDVKSANLLVSGKWVVKVADFGLGRQIVPQHMQHSKNFPSKRSSILNPLLGTTNNFTHKVGTAKWRAPELSTTEDYGTSIDVYSFGIVLWEICTRKLPFDHYSFNYEVVDAVLAGERPEIPKATVDGYSSLMMDCWQQQSNKRPPFTAILPSLENIYNSLFTFTEENSVCGTVELTGSLADSSSQ
jgi:hypothetical protein